MEAGRELDALIESHIFHNVVNANSRSWQDGYNYENTFYSTEIADAWKVIDRLIGLKLKNNHRVHSVQVTDMKIIARVLVNSKFKTIANTVPLAICLAALKVVGVEMEHA